MHYWVSSVGIEIDLQAGQAGVRILPREDFLLLQNVQMAVGLTQYFIQLGAVVLQQE